MSAELAFVCPQCHAVLVETQPDELRCAREGLAYNRVAGIWCFLPPERIRFYEKFMREYETVRQGEGRGSRDAAYYRALPERDLSGRMPADWRIRAASFKTFLAQVLAPLEERVPALRVLDLGAGNGWLSNRIAQRGHAVGAVDLLTNDFDGLGCHRYYETPFTPLQAEFDHLPLPDGGADLLVFNASLHYSENVRKTLAEALRVLTGAGRLVILDSPLYRDADSGRQMVEERQAQFQARFGFPSDALASENYLTYDRLGELGRALGIEWRMLTPWYGPGWALKPLKARLLGRREPAKFHVIVGEKSEITRRASEA